MTKIDFQCNFDIIITIQNDWRLAECTEHFGQFIGNIGPIEEKKKQNRMIKAVMGVE